MRKQIVMTNEQDADVGYLPDGRTVASAWVEGQVSQVLHLRDRCRCGLTRRQHETGWPACKGFVPAVE